MIRSALSVTKKTPLARHGMVVAEHSAGADVGARILDRGGNAVDAAVATAFAMTVVEPFMSTIAGSGTMLVHMARRGETAASKAAFEHVLTYANDVGLFAEEIDSETGAALGNFPQAFTHIGLINAALALTPRETRLSKSGD